MAHTSAFDKAVDMNKKTIVSLLLASGPQEFRQIKRECTEQAYADNESINCALSQLVSSGSIEMTAEDGYSVYEIAE